MVAVIAPRIPVRCRLFHLALFAVSGAWCAGCSKGPEPDRAVSEHQSLETSSRELAVREVGRGREHRDPLVKRDDGIRGIPFSFDAVDEIAPGSSESAVIALLGGHPVRRDWYRGGELLSLWWFSKEMLREEAGRVTGWTDLEDEVVRVSWHVALVFDNQGRHVLTLAEGVAVNSPVPTFTAGLLKSEEHMETVWYDLR